jgi:signal transduction histidine kinase
MMMDATIQYPSSARSKRLHGPALWLVRAGWFVVLLLVGSMFISSLPHAVGDVYYYEWSVLQAREAAATFFPEYGAFVNHILLLRLLVVAIFWITAVFIAWRKSDDWMVLYVSATLLMMSYLFAFRTDLDFWRVPAAVESLFPAIDWVLPFLFGFSFFLLFYLFPDGRFMPTWLAWGLVGAILLLFAMLFAADRLHGDWIWYAFVVLTFTVFLAGIGSQAYRWRQANHLQKQQSRLVITALIAFILIPVFQWLLTDLFASDTWIYFISLHISLIAVALIPITIGISALRYRLWGMDALLNRTLVAGLLTTVILTVYILTVGTLSLLLQTNVNLPIAAVATGIVALLIHPLRLHLQKFVNRAMYGQRDDPLAVLTELSRQLENTAVPGETLPALVEAIAETLKLPYVAIETGTEEEGRQQLAVAAANPRRPLGVQSYRLAYHGATIGDLLVAPRAEGETFTAEEERLLNNIARQAGAAVYAFQLTGQLQRSRERLVAASEEERRRLRRDLHDGLGPQLATLSVKIDAAKNLLNSDPQRAEQLLAEVKKESREAISEIRRVVDGLRPAALDQLGLVSALREFAAQYDTSRHNTVLYIDAPDELPALPAAVEVAAYRIITEAVTNVMRHARAGNCTIQLRNTDCGIRNKPDIQNYLCIEIYDNGSGLAPDYRSGIGLNSMRERALEVGGTFAIESEASQGTAVRVTMPIPRLEFLNPDG